MVFANHYAESFLNNFPKFKESKSLKEAVSFFDENEKINSDGMFSGLTRYYVDEIVLVNSSITDEEKEIFDYIEDHLNKYEDYANDTEEFEFNNAACVSFLENLLNYASADLMQYSRFVPLLGQKSQDFCRAWDEFTGVKSPGLWQNREAQWEKSQEYWDGVRK